MKINPFLITFCAIPFLGFTQAEVVERQILACVGDSITQGVGAKRGQSWPGQAQKVLGKKWQVKNFGLSGTTLMNSGNKPYQKSQQFKDALSSNPDVVVIMLGTNDTKPVNWRHSAKDYEADYRDLISDFQKIASKPRIYFACRHTLQKKVVGGLTTKIPRRKFPSSKRSRRTSSLESLTFMRL